MSLYVFLASFVIISIICCGKLKVDVKSIRDLKRKMRVKSKK